MFEETSYPLVKTARGFTFRYFSLTGDCLPTPIRKMKAPGNGSEYTSIGEHTKIGESMTQVATSVTVRMIKEKLKDAG